MSDSKKALSEDLDDLGQAGLALIAAYAISLKDAVEQLTAAMRGTHISIVRLCEQVAKYQSWGRLKRWWMRRRWRRELKRIIGGK